MMLSTCKSNKTREESHGVGMVAGPIADAAHNHGANGHAKVAPEAVCAEGRGAPHRVGVITDGGEEGRVHESNTGALENS